jgi:hypothetical protein
MFLPALPIRKRIYLASALCASLIWIPILFLGTLIGIGFIAILCAGVGFRTILDLPIFDMGVRLVFAIFISAGILLLGLPSFWLEVEQGLVFEISGCVLALVGIALIFELTFPTVNESDKETN